MAYYEKNAKKIKLKEKKIVMVFARKRVGLQNKTFKTRPSVSKNRSLVFGGEMKITNEKLICTSIPHLFPLIIISVSLLTLFVFSFFPFF